MKHTQKQIDQLVLTQKKTSIESPKLLTGLLCSSSKQVTHACMNQKCKQNPFVCDDQECLCYQTHQNCLKIKNSSLLKKIQSKKVSVQSLQICINNRIDQMIDILSKFRDQTIKRMKQDFEYFGLNNNEKDFLKQVYVGKADYMSGRRIWDLIISSKQERQHILKAVEQTCQSLEDNFKKSRQFYQQILQRTSSDINACDQLIQKTFETTQMKKFLKQEQHLIDHEIQFYRSKILSSLNEIQTLKSFFGSRKLKSASLIFRASDHNFEASRFHMTCDGISDTLLIVQTQFGKKIGGYTPLKWNSSLDGTYQKDDSMNSFLYSLTNKDKFELNKKQRSIKQYLQYGPVFGGHDLGICNKANEKNTSWAKINHVYKNENYQQKEQSWKRFCGNPNGNNFKVNQWQVWSLQFVSV